ncbi:MAG TPA: FAD-dependent oxidoreductase, partial [Bdellovibrio sp.]|nr:FAD-dependent oxidoreductase [Bdellovibrio sp.]
THSKGILTFTETFWRKKAAKISANLGNFTGDFLTQKFWDSGRGQEVKQGLLTYQRSGKSGESAGASAAQEALKDLSLFYPDLTFNNDLQGPFANWKQKKWAQGSMAYYKKNQFMRYKGVAGEPEYAGHFLFAGEHTSLGFAGTLQGALQSGLTAAAQISGL